MVYADADHCFIFTTYILSVEEVWCGSSQALHYTPYRLVPVFEMRLSCRHNCPIDPHLFNKSGCRLSRYGIKCISAMSGVSNPAFRNSFLIAARFSASLTPCAVSRT